MSRRVVLLALVCWPLVAPIEAWAADKVDFAAQIQPLLTARCGKCHKADKPAAKLSLVSADAIKAIEKKTVLVAGKPDESELFKRIGLPAGERSAANGGGGEAGRGGGGKAQRGAEGRAVARGGCGAGGSDRQTGAGGGERDAAIWG
jgi:hypothetical protein